MSKNKGRKYFIIYQITNLVNKMIYVGKYGTTTPYDMKNYWGSSKWLTASIKKHGRENFNRETLFEFNTEDEAYAKEAEIVDLEFVAREDTYNICTGGKGGWEHAESSKKKQSDSKRGEKNPNFGKHPSEETRKKQSDANSGENHPLWKKHHTEDAKKKMRESRPDTRGEKNPFWKKHHTEDAKKKMRDNCNNKGENNPMFGLLGEDNPNFGSKRSEESRIRMAISRLGENVFYQRFKDIKEIKQVRGRKSELARMWGITPTNVGRFLKKWEKIIIRGGFDDACNAKI